MKNELVHPELVRLFVALDQVCKDIWALEENKEFAFLNTEPYKKEHIDLSNNIGEARFALLVLIDTDILKRAKSNSNQNK